MIILDADKCVGVQRLATSWIEFRCYRLFCQNNGRGENHHCVVNGLHLLTVFTLYVYNLRTEKQIQSQIVVGQDRTQHCSCENESSQIRSTTIDIYIDIYVVQHVTIVTIAKLARQDFGKVADGSVFVRAVVGGAPVMVVFNFIINCQA